MKSVNISFLHFLHRQICCLRLSSPQESYCRKALWRKQENEDTGGHSRWTEHNDYLHLLHHLWQYIFHNLAPALCWVGTKKRRGMRKGWREPQRQKIATGSKEDPSGSLGLTTSSHWAVMRHMWTLLWPQWNVPGVSQMVRGYLTCL